MSQYPDSQGWERFKNTIRALYIAKGHPLEGPDGVIKLMENQHGFKATKAQYEKQFKKWGLQKNRTGKDWQVVSQKVGLRKRTAKESDVYLDGQLVPKKKLRKEISRHGHITFTEQFNQAQEMPPQTPPGFEIRTPITQPLFRLVFENLPILQFQEKIKPLGESIKSFDTRLSTLVPLLGKSYQANNTDPILPIINSLLPNSAFLEEACAEGLAIERVEKLGPVEFLNLATFVISNNFPGEANKERLCEWLKNYGSASVLKALSSMERPTTEALLENLFRFAIEAEDIPTVKYLINAGVNPNGHICQHSRIPENLNPLQFACIRGNAELAQELITAGSSIDQPGSGWKSSALVLAIIGENLRGDENFWKDELEDIEEDEGSNEDEDTRYQDGQNTQDNLASQEETERLLSLVNSLIDAGAAINIDDIQCCPTAPGRHGDKAPDLGDALPSAMQDGHSPLTVASKYRNKALVDLFIQKGADVKFLTEQDTSALHECLYSWEEIKSDYEYHGRLLPLSERPSFFRGSKSLSMALGVVRSLLDAGADPNDEFKYCFSGCHYRASDFDYWDCTYHHCNYYTALDLSVLTGSVELVDMMLCAGAYPTTELSLKHAIDIGSLELTNRFLSAGTPLSARVVRSAMEKHVNDGYIKAILAKRQNIRIKRRVLIEAIQLGAFSVIEYMFKDGTSNRRKLIHESPKLKPAIESCCAKGHIDILCLILDKSLTYQFSISSWFGESLYKAVSNSHDEVVDALLSAGADVNVVTSYGKTARLAAIENKNKRMVGNLISAGAILNRQRSCISNTGKHKVCGDILIAAIEWGDYDVVKNLLEAGANIEGLGNSTDRQYGECACITPLTAAIIRKDSKLVNYLISAGAAINCPPVGITARPTPLSAAIRNRDFQLVDFLIQAGANPYDSRALGEATDDLRLLQVLLTALQGCDKPTDGKNWGRDALDKAIEKQDQVMVKAILSSPLRDAKSTGGLSTALHRALLYDSSSNFDIMRILLSSGADPNIVWEFGTTSTREVRSALFVAVEQENPQKCQLLLEAGAKADQALASGMKYSPMQLAVSKRNQDIVRNLLDYGSDPNAVSLGQINGTPIQLAVENGNIEMVRILLRYNGNPNAVYGDMQHTPLQMASRNGCKEIAEFLLENGADVNSPPAKKFGATALQFAAIKGFLGIAYLLLENGADVNAPPAEVDGRTALEGAAEHGRIDMVQLLLNARANIFEEGQSQYERAVRRASENGHHAIQRLLDSYWVDRLEM